MTLYCSVQAGLNCCEICDGSAYYQYKKRDTADSMGHPQMELFRCGHGMCSKCYNLMKAVPSCNPTCPFCRDEGRIYAKPGGDCGRSHTLRDYIKEWDHNPDLLQYSTHIFMRLHRQIVGKLRMEQRAEKDHKVIQIRLDNIRERKEYKAQSRERAVCRWCQRNTFTSESQLCKHISAKHPEKILRLR